MSPFDATPAPEAAPRYRAVTRSNVHKTPQWSKLGPEMREAIDVVSQVLPFRTNPYVMDSLIDWDKVPNDPMYQLTFVQKGMLSDADYAKMADLLRNEAPKSEIKQVANAIRRRLNPHPAGQMTHNVPMLGDRKLPGLQHKYEQTVLLFPSQGQTCHAYCTFCFRWAQFVGLDAYEVAGGAILRDLFQSDDGGWLHDAGLLAKLVDEKLETHAEAIRAEGWKWIEIGTDFPYGHTYGLRRIIGETEPMSEDEIANFHALKAEYDQLEDDYADAEEFPEDIDTRLGEIETAMEALQERPVRFEPDEIAVAGVFVSIGHDGRLRVERGYVRPEDEPSVESDGQDEVDGIDASDEEDVDDATPPDASDEAEEEDDGLKPLSDRLVMELTAHRTLALRDALANDPQTAFLAALHAMALRLFYHYPLDSCVEITPHSAGFGAQAPGLGDTAYALSIDDRTTSWLGALPKAPEDLWEALVGFDNDSREALFAHCVAMTVNVVQEPYNRRPRALAHADVLAATLGLDMAAAGWAGRFRRSCGERSSRSWAARRASTAVSSCSGGRVNGRRR